MIWSKKQLVGPRMALDGVNRKTLELQVAASFFLFCLAEYFSIYGEKVQKVKKRLLPGH
jgi:hypothetical protein